MKKILIKIICMVLSITMLLSLTSCGEKTWVLNELLPEYYHYNSEDFLEDCDKLDKYLEEGKMDSFCKLYAEASEELLKVSDMVSTIEIIVDKDLSDEEAAEEYLYIKAVYEEMKNRFNTAISDACNSQQAESFRTYLDDDVVFEAYKAYKSSSLEYLELKEKEQALIIEYRQADNDIDKFTFTKDGKSYCYSDMWDLDTDIEEDNEIYMGILKAINAGIGEIYVELVKVRQQMAACLGYENYADYIDEVVYGRPFKSSDLEYIRKYLKEYGTKIDYLRSFILCDQDTERVLSDEKFLSNFSKVFSNVSSLASENLNKLIENNLYDIEMRDDKYAGSYNCSFPSVGNGYLFYNRQNTTRDYEIFSHEIGHYTNAILVQNPYYAIIGDKIDIMEIQSTGLQILFAMKAKDILSDYTEGIYAYDIIRLIDYAYDGFEGDEFERKVYADPDITLEKINQYSKETKQEYGEYDYVDLGYDWVYTSHYFNTPFYYLSYGIAGFSSLQIYAEAKQDYNKAVEIWENLVAADMIHKNYDEVMVEAGLGLYSDENLCELVIKDSLEDAWEIAESLELIEEDDYKFVNAA